MMKLQAGAFGTLSALTEVTLKAVPKPESDDHAGARRPRRRGGDPAHRASAEFALRGHRRRPSAGRRRKALERRRRSLRDQAGLLPCGSKARLFPSPTGSRRSRPSSAAAPASTTPIGDRVEGGRGGQGRCSRKAPASCGAPVRPEPRRGGRPDMRSRPALGGGLLRLGRRPRLAQPRRDGRRRRRRRRRRQGRRRLGRRSRDPDRRIRGRARLVPVFEPAPAPSPN